MKISPTKNSLILLLGVLGLLPSSAVLAESKASAGEQAISIDLKAADLEETLGSMGKVMGAQVSMHPNVEGEVTYSAKSEPAASVLRDLCRDHGLECTLLPGEPQILRIQPAIDYRGYAENIDLELSAAPLGQVLSSFATISGGQIAISGSFEGEVTLTTYNRPWPVILRHLCSSADCIVDWSADPVLITPGS